MSGAAAREEAPAHDEEQVVEQTAESRAWADIAFQSFSVEINTR